VSLPPLRDWQAGDSNRDRAHFQQAVDALRELDRREGRRGDWVPTREKILAKLIATPPFEAALTDARYWVQEQLVEGAAFRGALTLSEDTTKKAFGGLASNIHVATNMAELLGNSHVLVKALGYVYVRLEEWTDRGTINRQHYVFSYPAPVGVVLPVALAQTSGSAGTGTNDATWVYTVTSTLTGEELATGASPAWRPTKGPASAATAGQGYFTLAGAFVLSLAFEASSAVAVSVQTNYQVDTATQKFQKKTRDVLAPAGTESGWTDVHTGDVCT
jgi:hypothetical protein